MTISVPANSTVSNVPVSSPSPIRSSPLSRPPVYASSRTPSPAPRSIPSSSRAASNPVAHQDRSSLSPDHTFPSTPSPNHATSSTPSPPLSRSHPLLGSYPLSLLHSRMSHAHAPHSVAATSTSGFVLHLGAVGKGRKCPPDLRCPRHLVVPFDATYYDLEDPSSSSSPGRGKTPWVGNIDLERHYQHCYSGAGPSSKPAGPPLPPPDYPGYRVAPVGQLQILVKRPDQAIKVFLLPYDLRNVPVGGRMLAREKTYVTVPSTGKEGMRYAIQLQFIGTTASGKSISPTRSRNSSTTRSGRTLNADGELDTHPTRSTTPTREVETETKAYYVSKRLKVVFRTSPPESDEVTRTERHDEIVLPPATTTTKGTRGRVVGFSPGSPTDEWKRIRQGWYARQMRETHSPLHSPPVRTLSPLPSLLVPLRPTTPPPPLTSPNRTASPQPQPPSVKTPLPVRYRLRRGSGSMEERELSEKLRALAMREAG